MMKENLARNGIMDINIRNLNTICNLLETLVHLQIIPKIDKVFHSDGTGLIKVYYSEVRCGS